MRLKLTLAYDGTAFAGWQIQEKPDPPPTVQGAVEAALFTLARQKIRVFGAGRTDAGVHALGQVAHCDVPARGWDWRQRLNAVLPDAIRIIAAEAAPRNFHARKSALAKTYIYHFWQEPGFLPPLLKNQVWNTGRLDVAALASGLSRFTGEHDFASFQNSGTPVISTIRSIRAIAIQEISCPEYGASCLPMLRLSITGSGFLKQMARNIAGFLAAVGKGKLEWDTLETIMATRDRRSLPTPTAPARGLFLANVDYGENA